VVDVSRERGARARSSVSSSPEEGGRARLPMDLARLLWLRSPLVLLEVCILFLAALVRYGLSDGVPELLPMKRDISAFSKVLPGNVEPCDLLRDSGDLPPGVAVAETEDILGAALWEGVRWSILEVISFASGVWNLSLCKVDGISPPLISKFVRAIGDWGGELFALAFVEFRPLGVPPTELFLDKTGDAEPLASVQPSASSFASSFASRPTSK